MSKCVGSHLAIEACSSIRPQDRECATDGLEAELNYAWKAQRAPQCSLGKALKPRATAVERNRIRTAKRRQPAGNESVGPARSGSNEDHEPLCCASEPASEGDCAVQAGSEDGRILARAEYGRQ